jgi:ribosomal protein RSM22 (predicted rRNA methylase)
MSAIGTEAIPYIFVIDTTDYAGNFERELTAYCTGCIGECEVGRAEAAKFNLDTGYNDDTNPFYDLVAPCPDDHGCFRPCSIWEGKTSSRSKFVYNSVAIFFYEKPSSELIELMKTRAQNFTKDLQGSVQKMLKPNFKINGFRLLKNKVTTTEVKI